VSSNAKNAEKKKLTAINITLIVQDTTMLVHHALVHKKIRIFGKILNLRQG
jgi:hypothetical protein